MSTFVSLSTSVMLALLTSSVAASSYADNSGGSANKIARLQNNSAPITATSEYGSQAPLRSEDSTLMLHSGLALPALTLDSSSYTLPLPEQGTEAHLAFAHPTNLKESFMMAGDSTIISFSDESGSFALTFSLLPQHQAMSLEELKASVTKRFSDKKNMLYGEYTVIKSDEEHNRLEVVLEGFLKKPQDGILPDMQNYFMESTLVKNGYIANLSCEFRGDQAHAAQTRMNFLHRHQMCSDIIHSLQLNFAQLH